MAFVLSNLAHRIGESQSEFEILEQKHFFQLHHAVAHFDVPVRDLPEQFRQFGFTDLRGAGAAGFAVGLIQCTHEQGVLFRCLAAVRLHGFWF
ncbi:Cobyrinic acid a [Pseudomonas syringae pv. actinidiae]|uniref:Cobyrinic acid a n=1 Tax=Pseudomonas syringae pv. actinidiae TaxID=103796 RepID=A0A2V0QF61_PSESF|nr:Cobyrinic acid a [Pseudomonas syringae pv. actinidiae]